MSSIPDDIAARLRRHTFDEAVALVRDFLTGLDEHQHKRFLALIDDDRRALGSVSETVTAIDWDDPEGLLERIEEFYEELAAEQSAREVEEEDSYDEYDGYGLSGDDGRIDELDWLFAASTSLFDAGQFAAAAEAYIALFRIFELMGDGSDVMYSDPAAMVTPRIDVDAMKGNMFVAIGESDPEPARRAITVSANTDHYGPVRYALLDAWQDHPAWMAALETALVEQSRPPSAQNSFSFGLPHPGRLLREFYHRYRDVSAYEALCREIGPPQGWPYEDLVGLLREQGRWDEALAWTDDGLTRLPDDSSYRLPLQEARGQALMRLQRPGDALEAFRVLFGQRRTVEVYLQLREAAQATSRWDEVYPHLTNELRQYVLARVRQAPYMGTISTVAGSASAVAGLLGFAYLLEGDWQAAIAWATDAALPVVWNATDDAPHIAAAGLLRMGLTAGGQQPDDVLAQVARSAPKIIQEHGDLLEPVARSLPAGPVLDGVARLYEHLVEGAIGAKGRGGYTLAARYCTVIRSIRRVQGRPADFDRYYQGLLATYTRYSALKDELRTAIDGLGYKRTRR